jgi:hypothetical protein
MKKVIIPFILLFFIFVVTINGSLEEKTLTSRISDSTIACSNIKEVETELIENIFLDIGNTCFGYQAYPNPDILVCFDKDDTENLIKIGMPISSDKIAGGTWIDGVWWCCEYSEFGNSNIWIIDHITGEMTLVGASGVGLHGLAYDDTSGLLYACGEANLFTIDMTTGTATLVGSFGISGSLMIGIACDGQGKMYGEDLHTDSLYSIDRFTGVATLIGSLGLDLNFGQDMAIDKEEGICYLAAFTVHSTNEGALYTCDLLTGTPKKIGNFGNVTTQITGFVIPYSLNKPPYPPEITGPLSVRPGTYDWKFRAIDPDGDNVSYEIDWGDGISEKWIGPHHSGDEVAVSHTYDEMGTVIIRARVKDIHDAIGNWSNYDIEIPKLRHLQSLFWLNLFERFPNKLPLLRQLQKI